MTRQRGPVIGYHVEVEPARLGFKHDTDESYRRACDTIIEQIKRHVDDVGSVSVVPEWEDDGWMCSHCGGYWTEAADSPHNGGCCDKDNEVLEQTEAQAGPA